MATLTLDLTAVPYKPHTSEITGRKWDGYTAISVTGFFQQIPHLTKALKYMVSNADAGCSFTLTDSSISDDAIEAIAPRDELTDAWYADFKDAVYRDVDNWSVSSGVLTFTKKS